IVHELIQFADKFSNLGFGFLHWRSFARGITQLLQIFIRLPKTLQSLFRCKQRIITEVECASVVRLQNEESRHHRMKGLGKKRVISTEEFSESDHIVVAL